MEELTTSFAAVDLNRDFVEEMEWEPRWYNFNLPAGTLNSTVTSNIGGNLSHCFSLLTHNCEVSCDSSSIFTSNELMVSKKRKLNIFGEKLVVPAKRRKTTHSVGITASGPSGSRPLQKSPRKRCLEDCLTTRELKDESQRKLKRVRLNS